MNDTTLDQDSTSFTGSQADGQTGTATLLNRLTPGITKMIRFDHNQVLSTFHRYRPDTAPRTKQALAQSVSLALEVHAQLEEEIFYPALRAAAADNAALDKSVPEHDEMRRLIAELRTSEPGSADHDSLFMELMRDVMHHVADEETVLLPMAEVALADRLGELGAQMTRRRLELLRPRLGEFARTKARAASPTTMVLVGTGLLAGGLLLRRAWSSRAGALR